MAGSLPDIGVAAKVAGLDTFLSGLQAVNQAVAAASEALMAQAAATGEAEAASVGGAEGLNMMAIASNALLLGVGLVVGVLADAATQLDQVQSALVKVAAQTGQSTEQLGPFRQSMEDLFRTGLVDNWNEAARAVQLTTEKIPGLKAGAADTLAFATAAEAMAKAWGTPVEGVIDSAQKLITTFPNAGLTGQKALDLITETAQNSKLPLSEVDQIISGYGSKFAGAGLSAMGMSGLISMAAQTGITNFATLGTTVDTFAKSVANPPKGFNQALDDMGMTKTVTLLKENKITMDQALDAIYMKFSTMPDGPNKTADAVKLFGAGIEKIGGPDALGRLSGFTTDFEKISGAAGDVATMMQDDGTLGTAIHKFGANMQVNVEQAAQTAFDRIKSIDWDTIGKSIGAMWDFASKGVTDWLNGVETTVNTGKDRIVTAVNTLVTDATATWMATFGPEGSLWGGVNDAMNAAEKSINAAVGGIGAAFAAVEQAASAALKPLFDTINGIIAAVNNLKLIAGAAAGGGGPMPANLPTGINVGKASGGDLDEGVTPLGEEGPELAFKRGGSVQILSNKQSKALIGMMGMIPSSAPMMNPAGGSNQTNNNQRNMTINMNGVKDGEHAVNAFSMMYATRKI